MIKNNIKSPVKIKCIENGTHQTKFAKEIDTMSIAVSKSGWCVNKIFVKIMWALGYGI